MSQFAMKKHRRVQFHANYEKRFERDPCFSKTHKILGLFNFTPPPVGNKLTSHNHNTWSSSCHSVLPRAASNVVDISFIHLEVSPILFLVTDHCLLIQTEAPVVIQFGHMYIVSACLLLFLRWLSLQDCTCRQ